MSLSARPPNRGYCSLPFEWLIITEPSAAFVSGTDFRNYKLFIGFQFVPHQSTTIFHAIVYNLPNFKTSRRLIFQFLVISVPN